MAGKGDSPRPLTVSVEEFRRRFEKTFEGEGSTGQGGPNGSTRGSERAGEPTAEGTSPRD